MGSARSSSWRLTGKNAYSPSTHRENQQPSCCCSSPHPLGYHRSMPPDAHSPPTDHSTTPRPHFHCLLLLIDLQRSHRSTPLRCGASLVGPARAHNLRTTVCCNSMVGLGLERLSMVGAYLLYGSACATGQL